MWYNNAVVIKLTTTDSEGIMKKLLLFTIVTLLALLIISCTVSQEETILNHKESQEPIKTNTEASAEESEKTIISSDSINPDSIIYLGAFLLPDDGETEDEMFSYGGEGMCFNPESSSLFITGHNWFADVAEITIPELVISKNTSELNKAEIIQGLTDIKGSLFEGWSMEIPRAGLEIVGDNLFFCYGQHFEEEVELGTHGYTDLRLGEAGKVCIVGYKRYTSNDYMFSIPQNYIELFGGADLFTGRFRDGGWGGMGPSLYAVKSTDIINAQQNENISAMLIIGYDDSYNGDEGYKMNGYSHADSWTGGAFVSCDAGDAIIFAGTHGYGETWYGFSNGVVYPISGDENEKVPEVPPYPHDERGWWNDDFRACIAFYSAEEAVKSFNGETMPYEVQPYAFLDLSEYMILDRDETAMQYLGATAYDYEKNRLYVLELFADGDRPVVHVFTFE